MTVCSKLVVLGFGAALAAFGGEDFAVEAVTLTKQGKTPKKTQKKQYALGLLKELLEENDQLVPEVAQLRTDKVAARENVDTLYQNLQQNASQFNKDRKHVAYLKALIKNIETAAVEAGQSEFVEPQEANISIPKTKQLKGWNKLVAKWEHQTNLWKGVETYRLKLQKSAKLGGGLSLTRENLDQKFGSIDPAEASTRASSTVSDDEYMKKYKEMSLKRVNTTRSEWKAANNELWSEKIELESRKDQLDEWAKDFEGKIAEQQKLLGSLNEQIILLTRNAAAYKTSFEKTKIARELMVTKKFLIEGAVKDEEIGKNLALAHLQEGAKKIVSEMNLDPDQSLEQLQEAAEKIAEHKDWSTWNQQQYKIACEVGIERKRALPETWIEDAMKVKASASAA